MKARVVDHPVGEYFAHVFQKIQKNGNKGLLVTGDKLRDSEKVPNKPGFYKLRWRAGLSGNGQKREDATAQFPNKNGDIVSRSVGDDGLGGEREVWYDLGWHWLGPNTEFALVGHDFNDSNWAFEVEGSPTGKFPKR